MEQQARGEPVAVFHVLSDDETWEEKVRGDGISYCGPEPWSVVHKSNESLENFRARVFEILKFLRLSEEEREEICRKIDAERREIFPMNPL